MPVLMWDASALAKRYAVEAGSETVHALFDVTPGSIMIGTVLGYAETFSVVLRKRNRGQISSATYAAAKTLLRAEMIEAPNFVLLTVDDSAIFSGIALMERHHVNATDAIILALYLRYVRSVLLPSEPHVLVASDQRLVLAARAEGLPTLDPEQISPSDVGVVLARV